MTRSPSTAGRDRQTDAAAQPWPPPRPHPILLPRTGGALPPLFEAPHVFWGTSPQRPALATNSHYIREGLWGWGMHFELQMGIMLNGSARRRYIEHEHEVGPGDVWLCGVFEPHGWEVLEPPCEWVVIIMLPELLHALRFDEQAGVDWLAPFTLGPAQRPQVPAAQRQRVIALGRQMLERIYCPPTFPATQLRLDLMQLLLILLEQLPATAAPPTERREGFDRIRPAVDMALVSRRFMPVADAARACHMNRKSFATIFHSAMGLPFPDFALRRRVHGAAIALRRENAPIKAIAAEWGFTDTAHFHHAFKAVFHCTPSAYRRGEA